MSYPLIILGAGASFDYIPDDEATKILQHKAPLTDDLFKHHFTEKIMGLFPRNDLLSDLAGTINGRLRSQDTSLETVLADVANKGGHRKSQIISFNFYLQRLFQEISDSYGRQRGNNLNTLKGLIEDNGGEATIISFNYDLFLDQVFLKQEKEINSYVDGDIKLIKVHGSCDWAHPFGINPYGTNTSDKAASYKFLIENPLYLEKNKFPDYDKILL